jgi:RNA polymerase sigma-70 factor (ECF subfamily)
LEIENTNYVRYLIERAKEGRKRAFLDLCEINMTNIFTIAYRLLADPEATKKITLKTFFTSWDGLNDYDPKIPYALWVKNLTIAAAINELNLSEIASARIRKREEFGSDPEFLENLIISLPVDERIVFVLHDLEGYSYEEIKAFLKSYGLDEIKTILLNTRNLLMSKISL